MRKQLFYLLNVIQERFLQKYNNLEYIRLVQYKHNHVIYFGKIRQSFLTHVYRNIPTLSSCESKRYTISDSFSNKCLCTYMVMFSCNSRYAFYKALLYISILDVFGYLRPVAMDPCPLCRTSSVEIITEPILTIYNIQEGEQKL